MAYSSIGEFTVKLILTDSKMITPYEISITVLNDPPYFIDEPKEISLAVNTEFEYFLPKITDKEMLPIKLTTSLADGSPLPSFIYFNEAERSYRISNAKKMSKNLI